MTSTNNFSFSQRTNWELSSNRIDQTLKDLIRSNTSYIDLTLSNPTQCYFNFLNEDLLTALRSKENLQYQADSKGMLKVREAIAQMYDKQGKKVDVDNIFLTSSTSEAYSYLFRLLADVDNHVLFPAPSYPLFQFLGDLNDINLGFYPLVYDQTWSINLAQVVENLYPRTKAIVFVNPNNPTGSYISSKELKAINAICCERNMAIISDEVFWDYQIQDNKDPLSLIDNKEVLTFTLSGLSKTLGMPQMKLSWIVVSGPDSQVEEANKRLEVIADTYLSVNAPVQNATIEWLKQKESIQSEILQRVRGNYEFLKSEVEKTSSISIYEAQGGWYACLKVPAVKEEEEWVLKLLSRYHVYVHPGFYYDFTEEPIIVISLLPPKEAFQEGILRVLSRIQQELA